VTRERFAIALGTLQETFRVALGDAGMEGYWLVLHGLTEGEFQRACLRGMAECEFMPPPAKLLAYVKAERAGNAEVRAADEQIKRLREWQGKASLGPIRDTVRELAEAKDVSTLVPETKALAVTDLEKAAAVERMREQLAKRDHGIR